MSKEIIQDALRDFLGATAAEEFSIHRIHRKATNPDQQLVYAAYSTGENYALKVDLTPTGPTALNAELQWLTQLRTDMAATPNYSVIKPYALSQDGRVLITRFYNVPTVRKMAADAETQATLRAVMAQAGGWTQAFHASAPQETRQFWPGWMIKKACELRATDHITPAKAVLADRVITALKQQSLCLKGRQALFGRRHDDLNGVNLLLEPNGRAIGLDMPSIREAMQLIDAAQLICDIDIHQSQKTSQNPDVYLPIMDGFCAGYGALIDSELLQFLCRMQFLYIWLRIKPSRVDANRNIGLREAYLTAKMEILAAG